jgi:hypothetical protein
MNTLKAMHLVRQLDAAVSKVDVDGYIICLHDANYDTPEYCRVSIWEQDVSSDGSTDFLIDTEGNAKELRGSKAWQYSTTRHLVAKRKTVIEEWLKREVG